MSPFSPTRTADGGDAAHADAAPPVARNSGGRVPRDLVVIGASAGGVEALSELVQQLPADFPASVFVVLHVPRHGSSILPTILSRRGNLIARVPEDGETIQKGVIYVAPPDQHMVLQNERVFLTRGPSENHHRPAIDPLFRSAAKMGRQRVTGVVLSGMLDDGTAGLLVIKRCDGTAVVQEPDDALFSGMPTSALLNVPVDYAVPIRDMGGLLTQLVQRSTESQSTEPPANEENNKNDAVQEAALREEVGAAFMNAEDIDREQPPGADPSVYSCPECSGVLWEIKNDGMVRFRCRTGHAYSSESLLAAQSDALEAALWTALRALEESGSLSRRLCERAHERGHNLAEVRFAEQAREAAERAGVIRRVLITGEAHRTESGDTPLTASAGGMTAEASAAAVAMAAPHD